MRRSPSGCSCQTAQSSPGSVEGGRSLLGISGSCRDMHRPMRRREDGQETARRRGMRRIKTRTGVSVLLDGDLLAIMDVLYHEVTARHELERSFDDMNDGIANLLGQMTAQELREYLQEALFVNTITYENQRA